MEISSTGTKTSTGAVAEIPNSEWPQPHSKIAFIRPRAAPTASRFMTEAVSGMSRLRNTAISSTKPSRTTTAMNKMSLEDRTRAKSVWVAVGPPTRTVMPVPAWARGMTPPRSGLSRDVAGTGWGLGGGVELGDGDGAAGAEHGRGDRDDAGLAGQGAGQGGEPGFGGGRWQLRDQLQRTAESGPEALGQQVVGLVGGGAGRVTAGVIQAEAEAEGGQRDDDDGGQRENGREDRPVLDGGGPARPESGAVLVGGSGRPQPGSPPAGTDP